MDPVRLGADVRLLRRRKGWTQARLAAEAGVHRWRVIAIEAGRGDRMTIGTAARIVVALGGALAVRVSYRGEGLDRLRDGRHAALVERIVRDLRAAGWEVATEVTFNHFGERGSIDVLAFHAATGSLLVVEVKSVVPDVGGMLMTLDRKVRLAPGIAKERGWIASGVSRLLVLPEGRTVRRRLDAHRSTFEVAFPTTTTTVRAWLRHPTVAIGGVLVLSDVDRADTRRRSNRRSRPSTPSPRSGSAEAPVGHRQMSSTGDI